MRRYQGILFLFVLSSFVPASTRGSSRSLGDQVAALMNVEDSQEKGERRRFRFQNEEEKKSWICPENLLCGEVCQFKDRKGPVRVLPKGGCCPSEGWTGETSCSGHGACVPDIENSVLDPEKAYTFLEIDENAPKVKYNVMLTAAEQKKSLGSNFATDMAQSLVPLGSNKHCDIILKEEYMRAKGLCKKGETFGCGCVTKKCLAAGRNEMTMWVDKGCEGVFESSVLKMEFHCLHLNKETRKDMTKEEKLLIPGIKSECMTGRGFTCEIGQGPKDKKFDAWIEKYSFTRLTAQGPMLEQHVVKYQADCFKKCRDQKECVSFDYARISEKKQQNCRLYRKNTEERVGDQYEKGRKWLYCVVDPTYRHVDARCGTDKKKCVAAKCLCAPGWTGFGCHINLNANKPCSPIDPACGDVPAPPPVPCFGQPEDFPLDHPCRSTFAYNVPYPPRSPPKSKDGLEESLQSKGNAKVLIWNPKDVPGEEEAEGDNGGA